VIRVFFAEGAPFEEGEALLEVPVEQGFILIVLPVGQEVVGLFRQRKGFIVDTRSPVGPVSLLGVELAMEDEHFKPCVLIEEDETRILSGKAAPDHTVQLVIREECIDNFLLIVKPEFILQRHQQQLLRLGLDKLSLERLLSQLEGVLLGHHLEGAVGKHVMGYGLISAHDDHIWEAEMCADDSGRGVYSLRGVILVILHVEAEFALASDADNHVFVSHGPVRQDDACREGDDACADYRVPVTIQHVQSLQLRSEHHVAQQRGITVAEEGHGGDGVLLVDAFAEHLLDQLR
jgi:hypothetical protein